MKKFVKIVVIAFFAFLCLFACKHKKDNQQNKGITWVVSFEANLKFAGIIEVKNSKGESIVTGAKIADGEELTFKATPKEDFVFSSWSKDDEMLNIGGEYKLIISKDIIVKAHFVLKDFVDITLNGKNIVGKKIDYVLPVDKPDKPEWRGVFPEGRVVKLDDYAVSKFQTTYELWYRVYSWGKTNGYTFANEGREGSIGTDGEAPTANKKHPVTKVSWRDSIVWCNAYTQMLQESDVECVYTSKLDGKVLKDATKEEVDTAVANMERKGFRLLTEAEWEYATRFSGSGKKDEEKINADAFGEGIFFTRANSVAGAKKPTGFNGVVLDGVKVGEKEYEKWKALKDEATRYAVFGAWFCGDKSYIPQEPSVEGTAPVASKLPNFLGLYDTSGNVWEWVFDGDHEDPTKDDALYKVDGVVVNPQGKKDAKDKEKRGGSYFYDADSCVVCLRDVEESTYKFDDTGFRIACSKR
jgi:hypothetical protein